MSTLTLMDYSHAKPQTQSQHRTVNNLKELTRTSEVEKIQQEQMDRAYKFAQLAAGGGARRHDLCELAD